MAVRSRVLPIALIVIVVAALVGYGLYATFTGRDEELVIYAYDSLLAWGDNPEEVADSVFGGFERRYDVRVTLQLFGESRDMLLRAMEEKDDPRADVLIGIDNTLIHEAKNADVLSPFTPANLTLIHEWLVTGLDPQHYVVPYDYGLISFVYDTAFVDETSYPQMSSLSMATFTTNSSYSDTLLVEDPTLSSTGISFLLWEISLYQEVLGVDWRNWWEQVEGHVKVARSWGDAYDMFLNPAAGYHMVVSYGTDPAYSYYFYQSDQYSASLTTEDEKTYGWLQIEGIGLVKDGENREMAEKFIEYFLSNEVQQYFAVNNWMYPANREVELPPCYVYALDPLKVELLNNYMTPEEISANLKTWLEEWQNIMAA